jgi:hypothetical protein
MSPLVSNTTPEPSPCGVEICTTIGATRPMTVTKLCWSPVSAGEAVLDTGADTVTTVAEGPPHPPSKNVPRHAHRTVAIKRTELTS